MLREVVDDGPRVRELVSTIERNAGSLAKLVEDLLDVSRITLGHVWFDRQPLRLGDLIGGVVQRAAAHGAGQDHPAGGERIRRRAGEGRPDRRPQVIWNLLTIAVKLTEPHGRIDADVRAPPGR